MVEIRKARKEDLPAIHDMAEVVFRQTYKEIISPKQMEYMMEMMYSMANLEKQLEEGHHYYLAWSEEEIPGNAGAGYPPGNTAADGLHGDGITNGSHGTAITTSLHGTASADRNSRPCGYVSVQHEGPDSSSVEVFHLHKIYVMPDSQGYGIGQRLFEAAVSHVKAAAAGRPARIELNVNKHNKAVGFYKHLGLSILLEEDFPIGNGFYKTDYIMGLDI